MTQQEKPVAIFLPRHRPGRIAGSAKPMAAVAMAAVVILGGSLFFMMPRGEVAPAVVAAAGPQAEKPIRTVSPDAGSTDAVSETVATGEAAPAAATTADAAEPAAAPVVASTPAAKASKPVGIPRKDDPRWARVETKHGSAALHAMRKLIAEKAAQVEPGDTGLLAYAGDDGPDFGGAGGEMRRPMQIVLPAELPEQPDSATRTASVNAPVNMRRGPGSRHGVISVIPRRAKIEVYDCDSWCKVGYQGRTGFIYKSFVSGRPS